MPMLRFLLLWSFALSPLVAFTQVVIESLPIPPVGDSMVTHINVSPDIDISSSGADAAWEWTLQDTLSTVTHYSANDAPAAFPMANRKVSGPVFSQYLTMSATSWFQVGGAGVDPIGFGIEVQTFLTPGLTELYAPIAFGDSMVQSADSYTGIPLDLVPDSILQELPVVPDSVRVVIGLDRTDVVDAHGTLTLNGEAYMVARMRRTEVYDARVEAKVSILPWVDVTDLLLEFLPEGVELKDTIMSQRYIADGVGYPLAAVFLNADSSVQRTEHSTDILSAVKEVTLQAIGISPNPARGIITIAFEGDPGETYRATISGSSGQQLKHYRLQGSQTQLNLAFLPPGNYVLTVYDENGTLHGAGKIVRTGG